MIRAKRLLSSFRLANSFFSTQLLRTHSLLTQVNHFSPFRRRHLLASSCNTLNSHQKLFFSSKQEPCIHLILSNDWSEELEQDLNKISPKLTHEGIVYVFKKIDKDPKKASRFFNWVVNVNGFKPSSSIYSLMLRIYASKETMKEFWVVIKEMKEKGYYVDEETYKTILAMFQNAKMHADVAALKHFHDRMIKENAMGEVVKEVVECIVRLDWGKLVERKLGEMKFPLSENFVLRVFKELRGEGYPLKALSFFKWIDKNLNFEHNSVTYNGILRVLGRKESIGEFWDVMREMKGAGYEMDLDTYIKISRHFQKCKMFKDAVELYEHMMDGQFKPSNRECSLLLHNIASSGSPDMDLVFRVVNKYETAGYALFKNIYDVIHRSLTSLGRFDEAEKIVDAMKIAGCEPDNITYSQLIFGLCKARRLEEACEMLDVMEEKGCKPDLKTWTILIQGHCAAHEVNKALFCFAKMMEKDIDADGDILDVLINGFLSQERILGAYQFLVEMVNKARIRPWQATYKNLIQKLLGERKLEEALDLLQSMKKQNYPPFTDPFIQYISTFGTTEDAGEFLKALSVKGYPSISAYQRVFESFFSEGRHSDAKDLLYKCPHHIRKHKAISSLFGSA